MALKTKKFVQFLSAEKGDQPDAEKKDMENVDSVVEGEEEDKSANLEEKKDK